MLEAMARAAYEKWIEPVRCAEPAWPDLPQSHRDRLMECQRAAVVRLLKWVAGDNTVPMERETMIADLVIAARRAADVFRRNATLQDEKRAADVAQAETIEWILDRLDNPTLGGYPADYTGDH